jgi:putative ATP-dependent endonuclease of OLD family
VFELTKEIFLSVPEFKGFSDQMSNIAGEMLSNMSHALQFDFSAYDPSNYFKALRVQPSESNQVRAIEELGTGQQQILALSFAHAYAKCFLGQGLVFIVDEPEAHLHPLAQKWLAKQMFKMATDGLQLVITTHSPHFINLDYLNGMYLVRKDEQTFVKRLSSSSLTAFCLQKGAAKSKEETIIPYYSAHSTPHVLSGFFANKIVLVEGPTEEMALPVYLNAVGLDTLKNGIAVIGVGGKGNLAKWWRLFTAYEIPTFVCFDNDAGDDGTGARRKDALRAIGIPENQFDNLLGLEDWNISSGFCVFGKDFEQAMRNSFASYGQIETEEAQSLGDSKPIVAKSVAQRIVNAARGNDTGWVKLEGLRDKINDLH